MEKEGENMQDELIIILRTETEKLLRLFYETTFFFEINTFMYNTVIPKKLEKMQWIFKRESEINKNEYEAIPYIDYEDYFNKISQYISEMKIINYKIIDELKRIKMVWSSDDPDEPFTHILWKMLIPDGSIMQMQKMTMQLKNREDEKSMFLNEYDEEMILKEAIKEGIEQSRLENIKNVMEGLNYTAQQAMDLLDIPVDERDKLIAKLWFA